MEGVGQKFADEWIRLFEGKSYDKLSGMLTADPDMTFHSPVVHAAYTQRFKIDAILDNVIQVFQEMSYVNSGYVSLPIPVSRQQNRIKKGPVVGVTLLFRAKVIDPKTKKHFQIEGLDVFEVNEQGKAVYLKVLVRPLNSAMILANEMKRRLLGNSSSNL
eukprot:TRINITY_DN12006_c0_g1_i1.p2 TRINITY_DN12006_c0_g1~~TRINITY_DN12006_c0_g1_i1.p2  ORF type:complete len:160 (+),score=21.14 TRINITY_DN12006_c0_g1_i1:61-540(+)